MIETNATGTLKMQILEENQKLLEQKQEDSDAINSHISNQISSSTFVIEGLALFFTIAGIALAIYINDAYEKVKIIKRDIGDAKAYLDEYSDLFYERVKRDDTRHILKRLIEVPEDIHNVIQPLLSRDLENQDFALLKQAYTSDVLTQNDKENYVLVFMQHFPYRSFMDEDLKEPAYGSLRGDKLNQMFKRDIENLFDGVIKFLKENGLGFGESKKIVTELLHGLYISRHKDSITGFKNKCIEQNLNVSQTLTSATEEGDDINFIEWLNS